MARFGILTVACLATGFAAVAKPALRDNTRITEGLIAVGIAIEISDKCPDLSARKLKGLVYLQSLKNAARDEGYSDAEIDAFIENKAEKAQLESRARAYLAQNGASGPANDAYCHVGRAEIDSDSQAGRLLR
jgi:hypothetical protein